MEHNDLDKIFKEQIEQDSTELSFEELQSKEAIWDSLEITQEGQEPVRTIGAKRWWALAAALFFLCFGGGLINMYSKLQTQTAKYNNIEQDYNQVVQEFRSVKDQLQQLDQKMDVRIEQGRNQKIETIVTAPQVEPQYIEKVIYVKDTVYSIQRIEQVATVEYIRDTIFIKEQNEEIGKSSMSIAINPDQDDAEKSKAPIKTSQPKKVEFVIGNKSIEKPNTEKFDIRINGTNVASKNNRNN